MKLKDLMKVYDYTSPIRVFIGGRIVYDESDKYFCSSRVYDHEELEELEWYQNAKDYDVVSFGTSVKSDTNEAVQCIWLA